MGSGLRRRRGAFLQGVSQASCFLRRHGLFNKYFFFAVSFSAVIAKLFELGVPESQWATSEPWTFVSGHEAK